MNCSLKGHKWNKMSASQPSSTKYLPGHCLGEPLLSLALGCKHKCRFPVHLPQNVHCGIESTTEYLDLSSDI